MSSRSPSPNRRAVLASIGAAVPAAAIAAPSVVAASTLTVIADHSDSELLALRPAFLAALAEEEPLRTEHRRISGLAEASAGPEPRGISWTLAWSAWDERRRDAKAQLGGAVAFERWNDASNRLHEVMDRMAEIPATTIDGLRFKALAFERDEMFGERIVADLLAMGGRA